MFDNAEFSYSCCPISSELVDGPPFSRRKLSKKNENKRRFSDEQIKSLESMFESETRLEPRKKIQLASELGLQPRQVAIWFQNKRARWKSKQLERDYSILLGNFNNLASRYEALKKEKQNLVLQLQKLNNDMRQKSSREGTDGEKAVKHESEAKPNASMEKSDHVLSVLSDDDSSMKAEYFAIEEEQDQLLSINMTEPADSSPEDWGSLNSETLFNESSGQYQWWDFWS